MVQGKKGTRGAGAHAGASNNGLFHKDILSEAASLSVDTLFRDAQCGVTICTIWRICIRPRPVPTCNDLPRERQNQPR